MATWDEELTQHDIEQRQKIKNLQAENARLREALEKRVKYYDNLPNDGELWESETFEFVGQYADIAEEALKEGNDVSQTNKDM